MDDERRAELIEQAEAYRAVDETIKTPGWRDVISVKLEDKKTDAVVELIHARDMKEVRRAQEVIKAVDGIITDIILIIEEGREAAEELAKEKE
jgi:hypothetical protein